jgi:hypothetical protein
MLTKEFMLAGRASFVVENPKGESVTVKLSKSRSKINPRTGQPWPETFFVSVRHNNDAWRFVGKLDAKSMTIVSTGAPHVRAIWADAESARHLRIAQWGVTRIAAGQSAPTGYRIAHTGRCGKCGKMLRDAESVALGLGPICRG